MNLNVESHFSHVPSVDIQRSQFDRSSAHKTSFNVGDLIPIFVDEVLPGDTFQLKTSKVVRLQTLLTPILDNIYLDTYFFFVPNRIVFDRWEEFCGENKNGAWAPVENILVPAMIPPSEGMWLSGTIADYFGIPTNVQLPDPTSDGYSGFRINSLPFRGYAEICNQFFRDQNLTDPLLIDHSQADTIGSNDDNYITDVVGGGKPFKVAKYHDYFTSCLPAPQKGSPVSIPVNSLSGQYPVIATENLHAPGVNSSGIRNPVHIQKYTDMDPLLGSGILRVNTSNATVLANNGETAAIPSFVPSNLWADLSASDLSINISDLRLGVQLQRYYERLARSGSRYIEYLKGMFGVTSSDARLQRPEYLGGNRIPLAVHQVTNTAQGEQDFLGDLGAMSVTQDVHDDFVKSFEEHGFVIGLCAVRYDHTYTNGLERFWTRSTLLDYYNPVFAAISEQPVYKAEIFVDQDTMTSKQAFGFQEAWADYRYKPSRCSSEMRPQDPKTLASWHLADNYSSAPTLSDEWIREDLTNVDRVLSVTHNLANQVFADFYFDCKVTRPMPMFSVPGLMDHL